MNEKDKEAFEKWWDEVPMGHKITHHPFNYTNLAWQAACEYKQKEIDELEKEQVRHIDILKDELGTIIKDREWEVNYLTNMCKKLQAENAKLRECVEFYADTNNWNTKNGECDTYIEGVITGDDLYSPWGDQGIDVGGKRAREVLKELDNHQLLDTK